MISVYYYIIIFPIEVEPQMYYFFFFFLDFYVFKHFYTNMFLMSI